MEILEILRVLLQFIQTKQWLMKFLGWKEEWKTAFNYSSVMTYICVVCPSTHGDSKKPWINKAVRWEKPCCNTPTKALLGAKERRKPQELISALVTECSHQPNGHVFCAFLLFFICFFGQRTTKNSSDGQSHKPTMTAHIAKMRTVLTGKWRSRFRMCGNVKNVSVYSDSHTFGSYRHMLFPRHESDRALSAYWRLSQV